MMEGLQGTHIPSKFLGAPLRPREELREVLRARGEIKCKSGIFGQI